MFLAYFAYIPLRHAYRLTHKKHTHASRNTHTHNTHSLGLPEEQQQELQATAGLMTSKLITFALQQPNDFIQIRYVQLLVRTNERLVLKEGENGGWQLH